MSESTLTTRVKTHDYVYNYHGYHTPGAFCRIRIYEALGEPPVIVASELPENKNTSVTNLAEYLAAEVVAKHFPGRFEEQVPFIWIEHYQRSERERRRTNTPKAADQSQVTFASYRPSRVWRYGGDRIKIGQPAWRRLTDEQVVALIGETLE